MCSFSPTELCHDWNIGEMQNYSGLFFFVLDSGSIGMFLLFLLMRSDELKSATDRWLSVSLCWSDMIILLEVFLLEVCGLPPGGLLVFLLEVW